jgi:hypothetical protein
LEESCFLVFHISSVSLLRFAPLLWWIPLLLSDEVLLSEQTFLNCLIPVHPLEEKTNHHNNTKQAKYRNTKNQFTHFYSLFYLFILLLLCWEVHCDIYKTSYNIS